MKARFLIFPGVKKLSHLLDKPRSYQRCNYLSSWCQPYRSPQERSAPQLLYTVEPVEQVHFLDV